MKKVYLSLCFACTLLIADVSHAQFIMGLTVEPANPTTVDPVKIIAHVGFPSGDCKDKMLSMTASQNVINANALHCLGLAAFICYDYDTFNLGSLNAGSYTFYFQLDAGQGMMPCTPGINPGPTDSISFDVVIPTGMEESHEMQFEIGPVPARSFFQLNNKGMEKLFFTEVAVFQSNGVPAKKFQSVYSDQPLDISSLSKGWYLVHFISENGSRLYRKLLIY